MDSEGTNGEYIVMDCDVYIVMDSEVKLFMITEGVFLCVGDVLTLKCSMAWSWTISCNAALKAGTSMTGWKRGWRSLELQLGAPRLW